MHHGRNTVCNLLFGNEKKFIESSFTEIEGNELKTNYTKPFPFLYKELSGMETRVIITFVVIFIIIEILMVMQFKKYKQGKIDENPFTSIINKEVMIFYNAFFHWRKKMDVPANTEFFFIHKNSAYFWFFLALIHEQLIEMVFFHIWLRKEDPIVANIVSALHIYSVIYIMGDYNLIRNSPISLKDNKVFIKIGARRSLAFQINDIDYIGPTSIKFDKSGGVIHEKGLFHVTAFPRVFTRIFGIGDQPKYEIVFKKELNSKGYFGNKKAIKKAVLYIDQPEEFITALNLKLESQSNKAVLPSL